MSSGPPVPFWDFSETMRIGRLMDEHWGRRNDAIDVPNATEVHDFAERHVVMDRGLRIVDQDRAVLPMSPGGPPPRLHVEFGGFAPDYVLVSGLRFVSRRFREAADLAPAEAQFLPVDASACHPDAQAADYRMMWVTGMRDILDPARCEFVRRRGPLDPRHDKLVLREPVDPSPTPRIFNVQRFGPQLVTDAFAERMLRAGVEVRFWDVLTAWSTPYTPSKTTVEKTLSDPAPAA